MLLSQIAAELGLTFTGEDIVISGMNTLHEADLSELSYIVHGKYTGALSQTRAGAVLVSEALQNKVPAGTRALVCDDAELAMAYASRLFAPPFIDSDAPAPVIGEASYIDPRATLENGVVVGKGCTVMAGAYLGSGICQKANLS